MDFCFEHIDNAVQKRNACEEPFHADDLVKAESDTFRMLLAEAAEAGCRHVDASMIVKSVTGRPLSVICVHATIKRL